MRKGEEVFHQPLRDPESLHYAANPQRAKEGRKIIRKIHPAHGSKQCQMQINHRETETDSLERGTYQVPQKVGR